MPAIFSVNRDVIPSRLTTRDTWVCWQYEPRDVTFTKIPIDPATGTYASVSDPATWTGFDDAYQSYSETAVDGIGFVFTTDDPFVGIDLDDCRDPDSGTLTEWAKDVITRLDSYTEVSPSGTGVHLIAAGDLPPGKKRNDRIECYDVDRYFTVTGHHLSLTPGRVNDRTTEITAIHEAYIADDTNDNETPTPPADDSPTDFSDDELIEYAMTAENGAKFDRLWNGDTTEYASHSEADQALCNLLAFWTGGDPHRVERLFYESGLVREKWRDREDYRDRTIRKAIQDCPAYYTP